MSQAAGVRWYRHGGQRLLATLEISFASVFASWLVVDGSGHPVRWALLIPGAVLAAGFAAAAALPMRAGIAVTPGHIIIRAATRETMLVPWAQIAGFEAGKGSNVRDSKGTVYVLTADGKRLHTAGYGTDGNSPREIWHLLRALEDERLARAPGTASALPPQPPPERHHATAVLTGIGVVMLMIFGALPLYFAVTGLGPAIRGARGEGTIGYFIPQRETTGRGAAWYGEFRLPDGTVTLRNASTEDLSASAVHFGVPVAARDPGNSEATFPPAPKPSFPATTRAPGTFRQTWPSWPHGPTRGPSSSSSGQGSASAAGAVTGTHPHHRRKQDTETYVFGCARIPIGVPLLPDNRTDDRRTSIAPPTTSRDRHIVGVRRLVMRNGACMVRADDDRHRGLRLLLAGLAGPGAVAECMYVGVCPRGTLTRMAVTCDFAYLTASREE